MSSIEVIDELDSTTRDAISAWWRADNERLYGLDVVLSADSGDQYRKDVTLVHRADGDGHVIGVAEGLCSLGLGYLRKLIVDERHRAQGVGSGLLEAFEEQCRLHACFHLALRTQSDDALAFYQRRGWQIEFTSPNWFGGRPVYQLRKTLSTPDAIEARQ